MSHVPFELDSTYGGLAQTHGLISNEGDRLRLQFQSRDAIVGVIKSGVGQIDIPMADVASVHLEKSWFGWVQELVVQVTRLDLVQSLPGVIQGRLVLQVARKDRAAAEKFATELAGVGRTGKTFPSPLGAPKV